MPASSTASWAWWHQAESQHLTCPPAARDCCAQARNKFWDEFFGGAGSSPKQGIPEELGGSSGRWDGHVAAEELPPFCSHAFKVTLRGSAVF